jgi:hypothetical protein
MRVGLVGCVKSKRSVPSPAKDLYTSPLFVGSRRAVERSCDRWFILSAKHGLLGPDEMVEPYDETLATASRDRRRAWSAEVVQALRVELGDLASHTFEIHAGSGYYAHGLRRSLEDAGAAVDVPTAGLSLGRRLSYYAAAASASGAALAPEQTQPAHATSSTRRTASMSTSRIPPPTGKYRPLYDHLVASPVDRWDATFRDIEAILGFTLPNSARNHQAWWANETAGSHSHARAWLAAGFATSRLDLDSERVTFTRRDP